MVHQCTKQQRNQELGKIHGLANRQGLSEFQRRALQFEVTGKESCATMTQAERQAVIAALTEQARQPMPALPVSDQEAREVLGLA